MHFAQPAAKVPDLRRGPDLASGSTVGAFQRFEQRRRHFTMRGKNRVPGKRRLRQCRRDGLRAQRCLTLNLAPTILSSADAVRGAAAACVSSNSSMRANTVSSTARSGKFVMRMALR